MPYCVICGVELKADAKQCPLCCTEVALPPGVSPQAADPGPQRWDVVESAFDKRIWIQVVSVLMAIPALISVVFNVAFGEGLTWSPYVVASLGAVWVWCVSPFLYHRNVVPLWIAIDALALLGLLYAVSVLPPASDWFMPLAVPITLCLTVLVLVIVMLARGRVLRKLHMMAATLIAVSVLCIVIEASVDRYLAGAVRLQWSLLVIVTCAPLAVVAALLQRHRVVVEGMKFWLRM